MLSLVHQFSPTSEFGLQVHSEIANQYEGGLTVGGPSPLTLADTPETTVTSLTPQQWGTLQFARDLFLDYAESQLQTQLWHRWVERFPALVTNGAGGISKEWGERYRSSTSFSAKQQLPKEFVAPFDIQPLSTSPKQLKAPQNEEDDQVDNQVPQSCYHMLKVTVFDTRVASHIYTAISHHQFISLHHGKILMLPEEGKKKADKGAVDDDDDSTSQVPNPYQYNVDDDLYNKIQECIKKGTVPEDKSKCSTTYMKELEENIKSYDWAGAGEGSDDDTPNLAAAGISTGQRAKKRPRDGKEGETSIRRGNANPVILTSSGKGPFYGSIGNSIPALTAWISLHVTYIGALSNDEMIPSPFAFALYKLFAMKLLPNEIAVKFASHKENKYVRAIGIAAARYTFPPEELIPVLVPTLDHGVEKAEGGNKSQQNAPHSKQTQIASFGPPLTAIASAASPQQQTDITVSPSGDAVKSFALVVAEMALDPEADVCELWFPKYDNKAAHVVDSLKLRLIQHHAEIQKQKALMASVAAEGQIKAQQKGANIASGTIKPGAGTATGRNSGVKGSSIFGRLDPRRMKELAERHQRLQEAKNLSLIDENDEAFDVESVSNNSDDDEGADGDDEHQNKNTEHHVNAFIGSGRYVAPSHMQDESAFESGGTAGTATVISARKKKDVAPVTGGATPMSDEDALFRRTLRAEARKAVLAVDYGSAFNSQANRVVFAMLGIKEPMRADDDIYLKF